VLFDKLWKQEENVCAVIHQGCSDGSDSGKYEGICENDRVF